MQERSTQKQEKKEKIKVIFMIPTLVAGGAERVFAFVSQHLNPDKFSTELLVMGKSDQTTYSIDKVPVHISWQEEGTTCHSKSFSIPAP